MTALVLTALRLTRSIIISLSFKLQIDPPQQLCVDRDDDRAQRHEQSADGGRKQDAPRRKYARGKGDSENVITCRPPQVLDHFAITGAAEFEDLDHIQWIAVDEDQARGFDGNVCAAADGDAHIRAG